MIVQRRYPQNPRGGPSCLFVIAIAVLSLLGGYVIANADEVRDSLTPDPTPAPTRSAVSYATSGDLLVRDGEFQEAIVAFEAAIERDPTNVSYYLPLIELLLLNNDVETALGYAETAADLDPDSADVWEKMAAAHLANGFRLQETGAGAEAGLAFQRAVNAAETAVQLNPNQADAYAYMSGALAELGRASFELDEALEMAEFAVALDPQSATTHEFLANVLELQGYYNRAIEQYQLARSIDPQRIDYDINMAYLLFFTDQRQQAILTLQEAINSDPNNASAYDALGYFYWVAGEYSLAEQNAAQAVEIDPAMTRARAHLGAAFFKQNNYPSAQEQLELATAGYGVPSADNAYYFILLGLTYYYIDESLCPQAVPLFNEVLTVAVTDSPAEINAVEGLRLCREVELGN